mmetsp:Transcript_10142/g.23017  ORF Transcript_10142/g.23017 Transcript_10142/m.23017 type:complete len:110 (+) Transcript_10142:656-985(+)
MPRKDSGTKRGTTAKEYQTRKHTKHSFTVLLNESWTSVSPDRAELLRHASQAKEPETETVVSMEDTKTTVRSFVFFGGEHRAIVVVVPTEGTDERAQPRTGAASRSCFC